MIAALICVMSASVARGRFELLHKEFSAMKSIWSLSSRLFYAAAIISAIFIQPTPTYADAVVLDQFYEFSFRSGGVTARGCDPADPLRDFCIPSSGTPTLFAPAPAWTFS